MLNWDLLSSLLEPWSLDMVHRGYFLSCWSMNLELWTIGEGHSTKAVDAGTGMALLHEILKIHASSSSG